MAFDLGHAPVHLCHLLALGVLLSLTRGDMEALNHEAIEAETPDFAFTHEQYNATIDENALPKTFIKSSLKMGVPIVDPDIWIRFRIVEGDDGNRFEAEEEVVGNFAFLLLRTKSGVWDINRERNSSYVLKIKAVGKHKDRHGSGRLKAITKVNIEVGDQNDAQPLFMPISYDWTVDENTSVHTTIGQVSASDADIGMNGEVYYSFKQRNDLFAVHPTTGVVTLIKKLRTVQTHQLQILAMDRGVEKNKNMLPSEAPLQITVRAVNMHDPVITIQLINGGTTGRHFGIVYVKDADKGMNAVISSLTVIAGDPNSLFRVSNQGEGRYYVQLEQEIDWSSYPDGFNLTLEACDKGVVRRCSTQNLLVMKDGTTSAMPVFDQSLYRAAVNECVPLRTPVTFITAANGDSTRFVYTITKGNEKGLFAIDGATGLLTVAAKLSGQGNTSRLTIRAASTYKSAEAQALIVITDCNDHAPVFTGESRPVVEVPENAAVGSRIYQVTATDDDSGDFGFVSYSIANTDNVPFNIDKFNGQIVVSNDLDYETMRRSYSLRIRAADFGLPFRRETEMTVKVEVTNVNDNRPRFESINCVGHLSREAEPGSKLLTVSAIDFDSGDMVEYKIVSGNDDGCFSVTESTGELYSECKLQQVVQDFRQLGVTATDGMNTATPMTINITMVNSNRQISYRKATFSCQPTSVTDEYHQMLIQSAERNRLTEGSSISYVVPPSKRNTKPMFAANLPKRVTISEHFTVGDVVIRLGAEDPDEGYAGFLMFVINSGHDGGKFKVDTYSGDLVLMSPVDREIKDLYKLNISVMDCADAAEESIFLLNVQIADANDNAPEFVSPRELTAEISEGTQVGAEVLKVEAEDQDPGVNGVVFYTLKNYPDVFKIDAYSGIITTLAEVDREDVAVYELLVEACDQAISDPVLCSQTTVKVKILDINDNPPQFTPANYLTRVPEDLPVNTVILQISAFDPDLDAAGEVRFTIVDDDSGKFFINSETGALYIIDKLDYELEPFYNLTIKAVDRGKVLMSAYSYVVVEVTDIDENIYGPEFKDIVFVGNVSEDQTPGGIVLKLGLKDQSNYPRSERDQDVSYEITAGSGMGLFTVDNHGKFYQILIDFKTSHFDSLIFVPHL